MPKHIHYHDSAAPFPPEGVMDKREWLRSHLGMSHAIKTDSTMKIDEMLELHRDDHDSKSFWAGDIK